MCMCLQTQDYWRKASLRVTIRKTKKEFLNVKIARISPPGDGYRAEGLKMWFNFAGLSKSECLSFSKACWDEWVNRTPSLLLMLTVSKVALRNLKKKHKNWYCFNTSRFLRVLALQPLLAEGDLKFFTRQSQLLTWAHEFCKEFVRPKLSVQSPHKVMLYMLPYTPEASLLQVTCIWDSEMLKGKPWHVVLFCCGGGCGLICC